MLAVALVIAYVSSLGAAVFSVLTGNVIIPYLSIASSVGDLKVLPEVVFKLDIPQIMGVMSALVFSLLVGLAATWTRAVTVINLLDEFQEIVLKIVTNTVIPVLPVFIATTFCTLAYEGTITKQLPVFIQVVVIVMVGHYIWLAMLYLIAGAYAGRNPLEVLKHYGAAYITAVGTMSSAATLAVALRCARKSKVLRNDMIDFGIPLFANIHLCGSVLTETFFVMVVSKILYGDIPDMKMMVLFCILLGIFAIGAPGVPGGTVMASLGLITGILGFNETGTALILTVFALQDSFGTACNITGDGALTLILTGYANRHGISEEFMHERGLELSDEKTVITNIHDGFDFLGCNIRKYGDKLLTKPSKQNVKSIMRKIRGTIKKFRTGKQSDLIKCLNPIIRGWVNFQKYNVSSVAFRYVDWQTFKALWRWCRRRHKNKPAAWIRDKYFHRIGNRSWTFSEKLTEDNYLALVYATDTNITRFTRIKAEANPYDEIWMEYFAERKNKSYSNFKFVYE